MAVSALRGYGREAESFEPGGPRAACLRHAFAAAASRSPRLWGAGKSRYRDRCQPLDVDDRLPLLEEQPPAYYDGVAGRGLVDLDPHRWKDDATHTVSSPLTLQDSPRFAVSGRLDVDVHRSHGDSYCDPTGLLIEEIPGAQASGWLRRCLHMRGDHEVIFADTADTPTVPHNGGRERTGWRVTGHPRPSR